jgi:hypothetical protein
MEPTVHTEELKRNKIKEIMGKRQSFKIKKL